MKKTSAFITKGVDNVIPVLEAVDSAADAFPPLKSVASGALFILKAFREFRSNQDDWKAFVEYVAQAVACVSAAISQSGDPTQSEQALDELSRSLDEILAAIKKVPELQASKGTLRKFGSFLKDRNKISTLEAKLDRALANFHLGTTIEERNKLAKIFTNVQGLVERTSVLASNVRRIDDNSTLRQLRVADGSSWNRQKACQDGTRSDLLAELEEFASARDPSSAERIFLLTGVAGCGKTAIAQSVAERLSKQSWPSPRLGACFNFSAQVEDRRSPKLLFTTIAFALSAIDPLLETSIVDAISGDRTLPSGTLITQFDALIRLPLSKLHNHPPHPIVLVLDALDEVSDKDELDALVKLLANDFSRLPASCRVIITSRPDPAIIHRLESASQLHVVRRQIEQKDPMSLRDLRLVAQTRLREIATGRNLGGSWPEGELEEALIRKAGGLFIWLDVACKAIERSAYPTDELHRLLAGDDTEADMDDLYIKVLEGCPWRRKQFSSNYHLVLGTVIALRMPLSAGAIKQLLGPSLNVQVEVVLEPLASVVLGVSTLTSHSSPSSPLEISHESFREFVLQRDTTVAPTDKRKYAIDELESSQVLALRCLLVLNDELPPLASMLQGFFPNTEEDRDIPTPDDGVVSEALGYACSYWISHLKDITTPAPELVDALRQFFRTNAIPWIQLYASKDYFEAVLPLVEWLIEPGSYISIIFASEMNLDDWAQCIRSVQFGLAHMERSREAIVACLLWLIVEAQRAKRISTSSTLFLAESLHNLSVSFSDSGCDIPAYREAASYSAEQAVGFCRELVAEEPAAFVFSSALASALHRSSRCHLVLGQNQKALDAIEESVKILRQLAAHQPAKLIDKLASSLDGLSQCLYDVGRREEAVDAMEEAVDIYCQLATERPAAFNLAVRMYDSLNRLCLQLRKLGRQKREAEVTSLFDKLPLDLEFPEIHSPRHVIPDEYIAKILRGYANGTARTGLEAPT